MRLLSERETEMEEGIEGGGEKKKQKETERQGILEGQINIYMTTVEGQEQF